MNKQISFSLFKSFVLVIISFLAFSNAFAATTTATDQLTYSLLVKNLSAKLKTDLSKPDVSVKLSNVKRRNISANEIEMGGDALAILADENNQLPFHFMAKVDVARKSVSAISYDFVETEVRSEYAPTSSEEFLMKELMKKISVDYKTDNIVIALDGVENNAVFTGKKEFTGIGEVRIGDLEWNKIKFAVQVDAVTGKATKVAYDVKK